MKNRFLLMTACFACLFLLQSSVCFENLNNSDQTALSNALAEKLAKINFGTNKDLCHLREGHLTKFCDRKVVNKVPIESQTIKSIQQIAHASVVERAIACFIIILLSACGNKSYMCIVQYSFGKDKAKTALFAFLVLLIVHTISVSIGCLIQVVLPTFWIQAISLSLFLTFGVMHIYKAVTRSKRESKFNKFEDIENEEEITQPLIIQESEDINTRHEELIFETEGYADQSSSNESLFNSEIINILIIVFAVECASLTQITTIALSANFDVTVVFVGGLIVLFGDHYIFSKPY